MTKGTKRPATEDDARGCRDSGLTGVGQTAMRPLIPFRETHAYRSNKSKTRATTDVAD